MVFYMANVPNRIMPSSGAQLRMMQIIPMLMANGEIVDCVDLVRVTTQISNTESASIFYFFLALRITSR